MPELRHKDLKEIISLSGLALECNSIHELKTEVLGKIQRSVDATSSVYCEMNPLPGGWQFSHSMSNDAPTEKPEEWCEHYHTCDPFVTRISKQLYEEPDRQILSNYVVRHREYVESEFYYDFMAPQSIYHVMITSLTKNQRPVGLLGLHRPRAKYEFSETDKLKIKFLAPHLSASIEKIKLLETTEERRRIIDILASCGEQKGLIILNQDLVPVFVNNQIAKLFHLPVNQLCADPVVTLPPQIYQHCKALRQSFKPHSNDNVDEPIEIINDDGTETFSFRIRVWESENGGLCFLIFVGTKSQNMIEKQVLEAYSLSKREIDIAQLVCAGMSNPEIAEHLFISVRTVENHLRSIYPKVGVHNRTGLVSRLSTRAFIPSS